MTDGEHGDGDSGMAGSGETEVAIRSFSDHGEGTYGFPSLRRTRHSI